MANELNELFGQRYINIGFVFLLYTVIMCGYNYENLASMNTYPVRDIGESPLNYVLKYFLSSFLLIVIGGGYYVIRKLIVLKMPTPVMNFADLCSIANISILIFESFCHGYYIHGLNPVGIAEGTTEDLKEMLEKESKGNSRGRGLLINDPKGLQTFEFFIPQRVRSSMDLNFGSSANHAVKDKKETVGYDLTNRIGTRRKGSLPKNIDFLRLEGRRRAVSGYIKGRIEAVVAQAHSNVIEKTPMYRFLRLPPMDLVKLGVSPEQAQQIDKAIPSKSKIDNPTPSQQDVPIFMKDPEHSFERVMSFGHDFKVLLM
jgi:hypothetical protein